ncbi:MAG: DUF2282 domain-containing protein [Alphaproteobacteria bacterium]|nr:DUF2282 domain-containing protein [Alphaproteobacteria bacterium]
MKRELLAATIFTAIFANSVQADDKIEAKQEREKCYGVAKAEKNDCSAKDGSNACAGHAKKDRDDNTWVYVPKGLCDKLAGGVKG